MISFTARTEERSLLEFRHTLSTFIHMHASISRVHLRDTFNQYLDTSLEFLPETNFVSSWVFSRLLRESKSHLGINATT